MNMEFPHTAVIHAVSQEDAETLRDIFVAYGFYDGDADDPFTEETDMEWSERNGGTCYDIEDKCVYNADRNYYETRFEREHPELIPDDPKWFICSVQDFIAMCSKESINIEFDVAEESELFAMLKG